MGNIHGNCINVDRARTQRLDLRRPRPRPTSSPPTTRGSCRSSQKTGPDGCLYILDWYDRYHCYQDANRDPDGHRSAQGPALPRALQGHAARARFDLGKSNDDELIESWPSPNVYYRDIAQRLLTERSRRRCRRKLSRWSSTTRPPAKPGCTALWALVGSGSLDPAFTRSYWLTRTRLSGPGVSARRGTSVGSSRRSASQSPDGRRFEPGRAAPGRHRGEEEGVDPVAVLMDVQRSQLSRPLDPPRRLAELASFSRGASSRGRPAAGSIRRPRDRVQRLAAAPDREAAGESEG